MSHILYASAVDSLTYAMDCTRLDLSQAVSMVSRYMHDPGKSYWILRYIKDTIGVGWVYEKDTKVSKSVSDMLNDYTGDFNKRRFMMGYVFTLSQAPASWRSILQSIVTLSITKVKYMVMTEAIKEAI